MAELNRFLILGSYSCDGIAKANAERTKRVSQLVKTMGGKLCEAYALLGQFDLALIVDLPTNADALKLAGILNSSFGISSTTFPAVAIERFDMIAEALQTEIESARMEAGE